MHPCKHLTAPASVKLLLPFLLLFAMATSCFAQVVSLAPSKRVTINMGETSWRFIKDQDPNGASTPGFDDSSWIQVGVPYSADQLDTFINTESGGGAGYLSGTTIWYRKHFSVAAQYANSKIQVVFEGAHTAARVYLNGQFIPGTSAINPQATHVVGFVAFGVDLSACVKPDGTPCLNFGTADNVLAVEVAKNADWFVDPGFSGAFRFGQADSGFFRPVMEYITDPVHIPLNVNSGLGQWGTYVATLSASDASATVEVQTNVLNEGKSDQNVTLTTQIVDVAGNVVATAQDQKTVAKSAAPNLSAQLFDQTLTVTNPTLWYPNNSIYGKPYMYKVFHTVSINGVVIDAVQSPLGIRTITWDKNLPYFNGKPHHGWGASGRYDYPALGTSVPEEQKWRDLQLLAAAGGNLYRPGHSSESEEFLNAADALGIMVFQPSGDGENGFANACTDTPTCNREILKKELHRDMIILDRNHPSVLGWEANNGAMNTPLAQQLAAIGKQFDFLAPRFQVDRSGAETFPGSHIPANGDITSCSREGCEIFYKSTTFPNHPVYGAEYWGTGTVRQDYDNELTFAAPYLDSWSKGVSVGTFGMAQWYLNDSPGESGTYTESNIDHTMERSIGDSMADANRFPRLLYYIYQAAWTPYQIKPVVALAGTWNRSAGPTTVNAFSNCPSVALLINGKLQGTNQTPNPANADSSANETQTTTQLAFQVHWNVTWETGNVTAQCLDAFGSVVATDQKVTAGAADHIQLDFVPNVVRPDGTSFAFTANGSDAAFVVAKVVDAGGVVLPDASNNITFQVSGPVTYMGGTQQLVTANQPITYHSPGDHELQAEGGLTKIALRSQFTTGTVIVTATSPDLPKGSNTATYAVQPVAQLSPAATSPSIIAQPIDTAATVGQPAHFSVTAAGADPLQFQWLKNDQPIAGATGTTLDTAATTSADSGATFYVVVSNNLGSPATSKKATLSVVAAAAPLITVQPAPQTTVDAGQTATFSVTVTGSPTLQYQWMRNGTPIAQATSASYTTSALSTTDSSAVFTVVVTNPVPPAATSNAAALTVNPARPPSITMPPGDVSALPGQPATFSVVVAGSTPMTYQWQKDGNNVGTNSPTLTIPAVQQADVGAYTVTATNITGMSASASAKLSLAPPGVNLALGKTASASSYENQGAMPANDAIDGDPTTRWGSQFSDPQWLEVDLGTAMIFNRVVLNWNAAYASAYQIQVSNDAPTNSDGTTNSNRQWTKVYEEDTGTGNCSSGTPEDFTFASQRARYVRMYGTARGTQYGYSIQEFSIYDAPTCGGSSERYSVNGTGLVVDNLSGLTWSRSEFNLADQGAQLTQPLAQQHCSAQGMRLPTLAEAIAVSGSSAVSCAFPNPWTTWTSTDDPQDAQRAYKVSSTGAVDFDIKTNSPDPVLCTEGPATTAPTITVSPAAQTVEANQSATFNVTATGAAPLTYQWAKNGVPFEVTGLPTVTTSLVSASDNGAQYSVTVIGGNGLSTPSDPALLTVSGVATPPANPGNPTDPTNPTNPTQPAGPPPVGPNLALNMPASESSSENDGYLGAAMAFDGDLTTRWSSQFSDPQWIEVNLGAPKTVGQVILYWERAYGVAYQIQVTNDPPSSANRQWTKAYGTAAGAGGTENFTFPAVTGQYVRMYGTQRAGLYGYSLYEFQVYAPATPVIQTQPASQTVAAGAAAQFSVVANGPGTLTYQWFKNQTAIANATAPTYTTAALSVTDSGATYSVTVSNAAGSTPSNAAIVTVTAPAIPTNPTDPALPAGTPVGPNLALKMPASESSSQNDGYLGAAMAFDGDLTTRWGSAFSDPQWIEVDLGTPQTIGQVVLYWERAYGVAYQIQVTNDPPSNPNRQWTTAYKQDNGQGGTENFTFPVVTGRYVRMYGTQRSGQYGYSLYEFQIYGNGTATPPVGGVVPTITTQPVSQTTSVGATARFSVVADGTAPLTYQWFNSAGAIANATSASYITGTLTAADSGSTYWVVISNASGSTTSAKVLLTVNPSSTGYTIYPGFIGVDLSNNTKGRWADNQIYITVIAIDPTTNVLAHINADGSIVDAAVGDNDAPGHLIKNGGNYPNYSFTLGQSKLLKLPQSYSGRIFVSMGEPVYLKIMSNGGNIGYAGPNPQNTTDPNLDVPFDWYEYTYNAIGVFINTTQVDEFGLPMTLDVWGQGGTFHQQTGITESIAALDQAYVNETPAEFHPTPINSLRILSPAKTTFGTGGVNGTYFDGYIDSIWSNYSTTPLTIDLFGGSRRFTGTATSTSFNFTEVNLGNGAYVGNNYAIAKPTTQDILLCAGSMNSGSPTSQDVNTVQLALEAQFCAAFNRHAMQDVDIWDTPAAWYSAAPANFYARFWHAHSIGGLAYGFAYDDVSAQSSTITTGAPEHMAFGIGW